MQTVALFTFFMHVSANIPYVHTAEGKMFLLTVQHAKPETVSEETEATPRTESRSSVTVSSFTVKTRL